MDIMTKALQHTKDIINLAIQHDPTHRALIIFDRQSPLSRLLTTAYQTVLPEAKSIDFDISSPEMILEEFKKYSTGDLVILVQSLSFRLSEFRIRIELFKQGLAVIEHVHLGRNSDAQIETYIDALAYDPSYYRTEGIQLKEKIDRAEIVTVHCANTVLTYKGGMESAKLNIGDYTEMKNIGGTFPIGEVFSEAKDFTQVNGEVMIFAFADTHHIVQIHEPFKAQITNGILTAEGAPAAFTLLLDQIRADEEVMVREFGLGMNPAMGKQRIVNDITAFERQKGLHFSLGAKHGVYKKPGLPQKKTRYHIDVFIDITLIEIDGEKLSW